VTDSAAVFLEEYRTAAHAAGRLQAEAEHAEDLRKITLSNAIATATETSVSKAEHLARAGKEYRDSITALHKAKVAAAEARAQLDYLGKRWEKWRTQMASARVKQQMEER
jgi:hypothetical protein